MLDQDQMSRAARPTDVLDFPVSYGITERGIGAAKGKCRRLHTDPYAAKLATLSPATKLLPVPALK
jgi:hypothetical protein